MESELNPHPEITATKALTKAGGAAKGQITNEGGTVERPLKHELLGDKPELGRVRGLEKKK